MAGKYKDSTGKCGLEITKPCMCYTCVCWSYNGCPFSASQAWSCGDGCIVGPCIMMKYTDTTTVSQRWLCCPAEEWKRVEGGAPPTATEMAR